MERQYDFLVIGSGIAGLFYALKVAQQNPDAKIAIVTKKGERDTSTNRAQGGIAAVLNQTDSYEDHIADSLKTGCGLSHADIVEKIVRAAPAAIEELTSIGVRFTRVGDEYSLGREGGHSKARVVHAADLTGREIERALLTACRERKEQIDIYRDHLALDLVTCDSSHGKICGGAFIFNEAKREFHAFYAPVTLIATGGLGQVYFHTSNPKIATGDGVAIAYRAGVSVGNLEFIQFHPTTLYSPGRWPFLISEAVRGEGGQLTDVKGKPLMEGKHEQGNLAPRDVVARVIDKELKDSGEDYVLLDISHCDSEKTKKRFPNIYKQCMRRGFDITKRPIPVVPAAHYACGGVVSDINGQTELPGLYVAGEVAMSGMHGANRLASNSLLEAVVMADLAVTKSCEYFSKADRPINQPIKDTLYSSLKQSQDKVRIAHDRRVLTQVMSDFVGIVRNSEMLELAFDKIRRIKKAVEEYYMSTPATYAIVELRNLATVAELIIKSALMRKESRGLHYMEDYPDRDDAFASDTIIPGLNSEEN